MPECGICSHPGVHAVAIPSDAPLPNRCYDQCRLCRAERARELTGLGSVEWPS
jgi:hypothetical protein